MHLDDAAAVFGYTTIKPFQSEVVNAYMDGKDVFLMAPTGSGKSFTYEVAPMLFEKATGRNMAIVVSPLVALMDANVERLRAKGFNAVHLGSDNDTLSNVKPGSTTFVFASPESLLTSANRRWLTSAPIQQSVAALFVDKGHCIIK
jgi:ATP-dependent DNA helicase RecQ